VGGLVASFHLAATLVFVLASLGVAVRLLSLARRTGMKPELYLGLGILGTAVLGYGVMIAGAIARGPDGLVTTALAPRACQAIGQLLHDAGVVMIVLFVRTVFRPNDGWARKLVIALAAALAIGQIGWELENRFQSAGVGNGFWWLRYWVIWTYPFWTMFESYRWYAIMRKRRQIGLADPMVANRFFLWGTGALGTVLAVWTSSFPMLLLASDPAAAQAWTPVIHVATAIFGIATVTLYSLTFFPPVAYRRWVLAQL
jgi:hypothetical protein